MEGCRIFANLQQIRCYFPSSRETTTTNLVMNGHFAMGFCLSTKKGPSGSATGEGGFRNALVNPQGSSVEGCSFGGTITVNTNAYSVWYKDKTWDAPTSSDVITLTASNFGNYIACGTFGNPDYYSRGIADMVTISGNQWWNGQK